MADYVYNRAKNNVTITDLRVLLLVGYVFDADHDTITDVLAAATKECDFTNYARKALADEAWSVSDSTDKGMLDATDPATWADAGGVANNTISHMVVYEHVGADGVNLPVSCHGTGFPLTTNGSDLTVRFPTTGIMQTS